MRCESQDGLSELRLAEPLDILFCAHDTRWRRIFTTRIMEPLIRVEAHQIRQQDADTGFHLWLWGLAHLLVRRPASSLAPVATIIYDATPTALMVRVYRWRLCSIGLICNVWWH